MYASANSVLGHRALSAKTEGRDTVQKLVTDQASESVVLMQVIV